MRIVPLPSVLLAALVLLGACKTTSVQTEKPWAFACPPAGTRVTWDDGRSATFAGQDPADPNICVARLGEARLRLVWGMVEEGATEGRGHTAGMAKLFPAGRAATSQYTATLTSAGSGIQYPFETRWRVLGFAPLTVPAGRFDAVGFERVSQGTGGNAGQAVTVRYWLDGVSGVLLKREVETRGSSLLRPIEATTVALPPPPPRAAPPAGAPSGPPAS